MDEKQLVSQALSAAIDGVLGVEQIAAIIEKPKSSDLGDLAFPAFQLAKTLRKSPQIIAGEIQLPKFMKNWVISQSKSITWATGVNNLVF